MSYKKIPVLSKEQEEALTEILNFPATRPEPEWMDTRYTPTAYTAKTKKLKLAG
ncbi:MAG: hypothetical protein KF802_08935 [Bdellovibrionaceae bacterium]|nr:hypothetical protein [Pseudobdellovibrionaceae bacterium]